VSDTSYYVCDCPDKTHAAGPCTGVWFSSATLAAHARRWLERAERAEASRTELRSVLIQNEAHCGCDGPQDPCSNCRRIRRALEQP
jgi:hypothetical protein